MVTCIDLKRVNKKEAVAGSSSRRLLYAAPTNCPGLWADEINSPLSPQLPGIRAYFRERRFGAWAFQACVSPVKAVRRTHGQKLRSARRLARTPENE